MYFVLHKTRVGLKITFLKIFKYFIFNISLDNKTLNFKFVNILGVPLKYTHVIILLLTLRNYNKN